MDTRTFICKANCVAFIAFCTSFRPYGHGFNVCWKGSASSIKLMLCVPKCRSCL